MLRTRPSTVLLFSGWMLSATLLTSCGVPPELQPTPARPAPPSPSTSPASPSPTGRAPTPATPRIPTASPGFAEETTVSCDGEPGGDEVIAVLRADGMLPTGAEATVTTGPLCAGSWQYTVLAVPDHDPLEVVTRGAPGALTLVAAGTAVCTVEVRVHAPPGIGTAASCVG